MRISEGIELRKPNFRYGSVDEFQDALNAKNNGAYKDHKLYPRDGTPDLARLERNAAELIGIPEGHVLFTNSGMSAINIALSLGHLRVGNRVLHAEQAYSQTNGYFKDDLVEDGIVPIRVNSGSIGSIDDALIKYQPKVVFFETVSNGPDMAVLDVERFLELPSLTELNPLVILDNTLPTSNLPLAEIMKDYPGRLIGVESATKSYAFNQEIGGIVFSHQKALIEELQKKRKRLGATLGTSATITIQGVIPPSKEQFDRENAVIHRNTWQLAAAAASALGNGDKFFVTYPNLPDHPDSLYANKRFPNGAAPVFFIQPNIGTSHLQIAYALEQSLSGSDYYLAQSFAFDKTGISFDEGPVGGYVRIAGGLENPPEIEQMQTRFYRALSSL